MHPQAFYVDNGHAITINFFTEQGGAIDEYFAWCHTCDPEGGDFIAKIDFQEWPLSTEAAVLNLFTAAVSHARY